jgi:hypothetical protein
MAAACDTSILEGGNVDDDVIPNPSVVRNNIGSGESAVSRRRSAKALCMARHDQFQSVAALHSLLCFLVELSSSELRCTMRIILTTWKPLAED